MQRKLLGGALAIAACCAIFGAAGYDQTTVVQADCTKTINGKQLATESGTLVCDCTVTGTSCACIVPTDCPKGGGGDFDVEAGGGAQ
jgi:hypothetical protein